MKLNENKQTALQIFLMVAAAALIVALIAIVCN